MILWNILCHEDPMIKEFQFLSVGNFHSVSILHIPIQNSIMLFDSLMFMVIKQLIAGELISGHIVVIST